MIQPVKCREVKLFCRAICNRPAFVRFRTSTVNLVKVIRNSFAIGNFSSLPIMRDGRQKQSVYDDILISRTNSNGI